MRRRSLRLRLAAAGALAVVAALALAGFALSLLFETHVERRAVAELSVHLDQLVAGLERDAAGRLVAARPLADPRFATPLSGLYWQVSEPEASAGEPLLASRSLWDEVLRLPQDELSDGMLHVHRLPGPAGQRLLVLERRVSLPARLGGTAMRVAVALDRAELEQAVQAFLRDLAAYLGLLALALILAGWLQLAVGLRPLRRVGRRVAAVRSGAAARLGDDFPTEVLPLAVEVDSLIAAREAEVARAGARAADLAHGLKTPLQALIGEAARLRARGETAAADGIEEIAAAMRRNVDRELARTRSALRAPAASCDAAAVLARVAAVVARTPEGSRLAWRSDAEAGLRARIDADDLTEVLGALVENAARHARSEIALAVARVGEAVVVTIRDDGPGIAADQLDRLLDRGARLESGGHGLGLAIARELVEAAGGALGLADGRPGLEVRVSLPAAPGQGAQPSGRPPA